MANLKTGEIWVCKEPHCAAEMQVLRGANSSCHGKFVVRCCCGKDMSLKETGADVKKPEHAFAGAR